MRALLVMVCVVTALLGTASAASAVPDLEVDPDSIEFGIVEPGAVSQPAQVRVTNAGSSSAEDVTFTLGGVDADQFAIPESSACATMPPAVQCLLLVRFAPTRAGVSRAVFEVRVDGVVIDHVELAGTGGSPLLEASPETVDFGSVTAGQESVPVELRIRNAGTAAAHDVSFRLVGLDADQFDAPAAGPCATLPAGAECRLLLRFVPTELGGRAASFLVLIGAAPALAVPLTGTGLPTGVPRARARPGAIGFPSTALGRTATTQLAVANAGDTYSLLGIDTVELAGVDTGQFEIVSDACAGAQLVAGARCTIRIAFTPSARGVARATLALTSNDPASPLVVPLSGVGGGRKHEPSFEPVVQPPAGPPPQPPAGPPLRFELAWLKGQVTTRMRRYALPLRSPFAAEATTTVTVDGLTISTRLVSLRRGRNVIVVTGLHVGRNVVTIVATTSADGIEREGRATKVVTVVD